jgi:hypothetical protein
MKVGKKPVWPNAPEICPIFGKTLSLAGTFWGRMPLSKLEKRLVKLEKEHSMFDKEHFKLEKPLVKLEKRHSMFDER